MLEPSWRATSPTGKVLTCALYRGVAGRVEVRAAYAHDNLIRSALVGDVLAGRAMAAAWKDAAIAKGFVEVLTSDYGHAYVEYPFKYLDQFRGYEREAREARRGLWVDSPSVAEQKAPSTEPARVWVNTASKVYHCAGTRHYGNTSRGTFMTEAEAQARGYRAAYSRVCGPGSAPAAPTRIDAADVPRKVPAPQSAATGSLDTEGVSEHVVPGLSLPGHPLLRRNQNGPVHATGSGTSGRLPPRFRQILWLKRSMVW